MSGPVVERLVWCLPGTLRPCLCLISIVSADCDLGINQFLPGQLPELVLGTAVSWLQWSTGASRNQATGSLPHRLGNRQVASPSPQTVRTQGLSLETVGSSFGLYSNLATKVLLCLFPHATLSTLPTTSQYPVPHFQCTKWELGTW